MRLFSALIDASTRALLALTASPSIATFLAKSAMEMEAVHHVNYPNYLKEFPLALAKPETYPEWTWVPVRRFAATPKELLTEQLRQCSALAVGKTVVLLEMGQAISRCRYPVWREILMQETVYLTKKMQAERFKDEFYPEDDILQYPYVLQYAEVSGLSLRAAADEILFKAKLDDEILAKTEFIRMRYFNWVRDAKEIAIVGKILEGFRQEIYREPL